MKNWLWIGCCCLCMACGTTIESRFFVEGACEACKDIIEQGLQGTDGLASIQWDPQTSITTVEHDPDLLSEEAVQEKIAELGFNTQYFDANENARQQLPACCRTPIDHKLQRDTVMQPY